MYSVVLALILCQSAQESNYGTMSLPWLSEKQQASLSDVLEGLCVGGRIGTGRFNQLFLFINIF